MIRSLSAVAVVLAVSGCAGSALGPSQHQPPSVAVVPPSFYYHYRYSTRLHRRVREVIRAEDLQAPTPDEQSPQKQLDAASDALYQLRKGASK